MAPDFLLLGSYGYVGEAIARSAVQNHLTPILAGRNVKKLKTQAAELGLEYRVLELEDRRTLDSALENVSTVLNCAGPFIHTFLPVLESCLRTRTHYLDITGEIPVYEAIAARGAEAKEQGIMLLPGAGFDVVPTDCLALHLKQRLPSATHLTIAFQGTGPAKLPPGTFKTLIEMVPYGIRRRQGGKIILSQNTSSRMIDFYRGPVKAVSLTWGDIFTAYYSTGIPNIEDFISASKYLLRQMDALNKLRPLFKLPFVRELFKRLAPGRSTAEELAKSQVHIWGEVEDDQGRKAVSRLHGPEPGVIWTSLLAVLVLQKVLDGNFRPGFMTPALAYGADLIMECPGVRREDLS